MDAPPANADAATVSLTGIDATPDGYAGPFASAAFVSLSLVGLLLCAAVSLSRSTRSRRAIRGREAARAGAPLPTDGNLPFACALYGRISTENGRAEAVRVEVDEQGRERLDRSKRKIGEVGMAWTHSWREVARRVVAVPFVLVLEGGRRVRVEPDRRVVLEADLVGAERKDRSTRTRSAALEAGAQVHVSGVLSLSPEPRAYASSDGNDGAPRLRMRADAGSPLVISRDPASDHDARCARFHRRSAIFLAGFAVLLQCTLYGEFNALRLFGRVASSSIISHGEHKDSTTGARPAMAGYVLDGDYRDERGRSHLVSLEVSPAFWNASWKLPRDARLPLLLLPRLGLVQVGASATTSSRSIVLGVLLVAGTIAIWLLWMPKRPWYRGRPTVEQANGRLRA